MWIICIKFRYFSRKLLLALVTLSSYAFFKLNHKFWNNFNNKANPIFSCIISYSTEGCTLHICEAYCIFRIPPQKRVGKVHFPPINYFFLPSSQGAPSLSTPNSFRFVIVVCENCSLLLLAEKALSPFTGGHCWSTHFLGRGSLMWGAANFVCGGRSIFHAGL